MEINLGETLSLEIPYAKFQTLVYYAKAAEGEIQGFADVVFDKEIGVFKIGNIYLPHQTAGALSVESDKEIAQLLVELTRQGAKELPKLWWHTHADIAAFFSVTDDDTIKTLNNNSFMMALVLNRKGETEAQLKVNAPIPFVIENFPVSITREEGGTIPPAIIKEVKEKVKIDESYGHDFSKKDKPIWPSEGDLLRLPVYYEQRKEFIKENNLKKVWDIPFQLYVWESPQTHLRYYDPDLESEAWHQS